MSTANSAGVVLQAQNVRCARCHRALKHPKFIAGTPYGSVCIKKAFGSSTVEIDEQVRPAPHDVTEVAS